MLEKYIFKIKYSIYTIIAKLKFTLKGIKYGKKIRILGNVYTRNKGIIKIGDEVNMISGKYFNPIGGDTTMRIIVKNNAMLSIGKKVGISNSTIYCANNIVIKDYVLIGGGCKIWDTDFHSLIAEERRLKGDNVVKTAAIEIDEFAFIGGNSIILKGVKIGKNSIIGAGSVVTKNVPNNEIWGGNPAQFIKKII